MKRYLVLLAAMLLSACAQMQVQKPMTPTPSFAGPHLEADRFVSFDGARLGLTTWLPQGDDPWAVIVGLHGMDDYANAFHLAAPYWASKGIATYAYDQRGFGRSPDRGIWGGDALMTRDLDTMVALVRAKYPHAIIAVVGESMGGAVAIEAFASAHPPDADRLVLLAPAVWGWSSQPPLNSLALTVAAHLAPAGVVEPPKFVTDHIQASDNVPELIAMGKDPLMIWGARTDTLYGLVSMMERAWREIGDIRAPTLYAVGAHDEIIPRKPAISAAERLPVSARTVYYPEGWHLLLRDKQAKNVWEDVAAFIHDPGGPLPSGAPPIPGAGGLVTKHAAR